LHLHSDENISTSSVEYLVKLELLHVQAMATILFTTYTYYFFHVPSTSSCIVNVDILLKREITEILNIPCMVICNYLTVPLINLPVNPQIIGSRCILCCKKWQVKYICNFKTVTRKNICLGHFSYQITYQAHGQSWCWGKTEVRKLEY
jgi:hypothetical protein